MCCACCIALRPVLQLLFFYLLDWVQLPGVCQQLLPLPLLCTLLEVVPAGSRLMTP